MKHLLFILACIAALFTACSDNDGDDDSIKIAKNQKNQTAYADETERTINFTAAEAWRTEVAYTTTRAENEENWVTLDPPSGEAGEVTINVTLDKNFTGKNRRAEITIICGNTRITVIIEQKGETEEGEIPDDEDQPAIPDVHKKLISKIIANRIASNDHNYTREWVYEYDDQNRVISYKENENNQYDAICTYTYSDNTITSIELEHVTDDWNEEHRTTYTLNEQKNVETWHHKCGETNSYSGKITYDENGYFIASSSEDEGKPSSDEATWSNGNLVKVVDEDGYTTTVEYGDLPNRANLDLNYVLVQTEWLGCMGFESDGIKFMGYFGKRSANLMTKETETRGALTSGNYHIYTYETDKEGYITAGTITSYHENGSKYARMEYTITYIDAK